MKKEKKINRILNKYDTISVDTCAEGCCSDTVYLEDDVRDMLRKLVN